MSTLAPAVTPNSRVALQNQTSQTMCLSLKQMEWADVYRRITGNDKEPIKEKKIQKFPSRERNFAVKRKFNNNMRSHANCENCARVAEKENR